MVHLSAHFMGANFTTRLFRPIALTALLAGCGSGSSGQPVTRTVSAPPVHVAASAPAGTGPVAVAVGAGGVWVADGAGGSVTRVDPQSHAAGRPIPVGSGPLAIAAGTSGVWVANASGTVVHVDPNTSRVAGPPIPVADPAGVTEAAGSVWVTSRQADSVVRIDPIRGAARGAPIRVGAQPTDIAEGAGAVWVANSADGTVSRIDAASGAVAPPIRVARNQPPRQGLNAPSHEQPGAEVLGLAAGGSGAWVAKTDSAETQRIEIVHLAGASGSVTGYPIAVTGAIPMRLAVGPTAVWVTDAGGLLAGQRTPALLRIDPGAGARAGAPAAIGPEPTGVAVGAGGVWVTTAGDNRVSEVVSGG